MAFPSEYLAQLPPFSTLNPELIKPTVAALIEKNRRTLDTLLAQPLPYTWENLMAPLEEMSDALNKIWSPIAHLHGVMGSEAWRKAYNETLEMIIDYHTEYSQNEALFKAISSIADHPNFTSLHPAKRRLIENEIRDFKMAGVHLSQEKKAKMSELQKKLGQLATTFSEHVLDATHAYFLHVEDVKQLAGLPPHALALASENATSRGLSGYVITLDYPAYSTALKFLQDRSLRQALYEAYSTRASDQGPHANQWDNTAIMEEIVSTRSAIAHLLDYKNYAEYSLATKMAKSPDTVLHFLNDLLDRSKALAENEYQALQTIAKEEDGITHIQMWDIAYYSEKLRAKTFNFSPEDLRPYFPIDIVLKGLFDIVQTLYGLRIHEEKNITVWHPDVRFFSIYDESDTLRGGFYTDLYARSQKRDGAWMDECLARRKLSNGTLQLPIAYLTCNFMPPTADSPSLLTHDDVLTLFHEFGHSLHHVLTTVDYPSVGGINGVAWDAVEFPSQLMENFCWEKEALALLASHYQTHQPLPDALYHNMLQAKHFQTGLQMLKQLEYALFDFHLHLDENNLSHPRVQAILDDVRKKTAIIPNTPSNRFQHSFSHIFAGGYAAGYYSYKWAEVLSADAYAQFEENGIFNPEIGRHFMHEILEVGGTRDPMTSFVAFRGREPIIEPLLKQSGIIEN